MARRLVSAYLKDEDWRDTKARAARAGMSVSQFIESSLGYGQSRAGHLGGRFNKHRRFYGKRVTVKKPER